MSNDGSGKIKQKKVHFSGKPYERAESKHKDDHTFLGKVKETVKSLFTPSWFLTKSTPQPPQANATSGALLEQLTAPPLNAGEELYTNTAVKKTAESNDVTPHPYQLTHRFVSPPHDQHNSVPQSSQQQRPAPVPYLTHLGGQRIGNSLEPFTPRVSSRPPDIRVSAPPPRPSGPDPPEPRPSSSRDEPDSSRPGREESSRLDLSQSSLSQSVLESRHNRTEPVYRSRTSVLDTSELARKSSSPNPNASKPAFNISLFANSRLVNDQTMSLLGIDSQQSPYYPGKTMYGGASSHRKTRLNPGQPYSRTVGIRKMAAKTSPNTVGTTVTSSTARKILDALDSMGSVLGDAKKVPLNTSSMMDTSTPYTPRSYGRTSGLRRPTPSGAPPIGRLSTPGAASIASNRQSSLLRQSASTSRKRVPPRNVEPSLATPVLPRSGKMRREKAGLHYKAARDSDTDDDDNDAHGLDYEDLPTPSFQLPVPANFNLSTFGAPSSRTPEAATAVGVAGASGPGAPFRFSSPTVNTPPASKTSAVTNQGFQFSSPFAVPQTHKTGSGAPLPTLASSISNNGPSSFNAVPSMNTPSFQFDPSKAKVKATASKSSEVTVASPTLGSSAIKQGSVMDILGGGSASSSSTSVKSTSEPAPLLNSTATNDLAARFKPAANSWECPCCLINNTDDKDQCAACNAPRPSQNLRTWTCSKCSNGTNAESALSCSKCGQSKFPAVKNDQALAEKFKPKAGSWECSACMVQNKAEADSCVCCQTAKPNVAAKPKIVFTNTRVPGKWECPECMIMNDNAKSKCAACMTSKPGGASSNGSVAERWECPTCWVQNEQSASQCVACTAPNPSKAEKVTAQSIADKFKKPTGSWECDMCMVFNDSAAVKCMACETPRPGAATATSNFSKAPSYQFGESGTGGFKCQTGSSNGGFTFGGQKLADKPPKIDAPSTGFKFAGATSSGGFKFGGAESGKSTGVGLSFGSNGEKTETMGFKMPTQESGEKNSGTQDSGEKKSGFTFGAPSDGGKKDGGFTFGAPKNDEKNESGGFSLSTSNSDGKKESGISFSLPKNDENKGFTFGAPKNDEKKESGFSFSAGKTDEKKDSGFTFGALNESQKNSGGFSFPVSKTTEKEPSLNATGGFQFGKPAEQAKDQPVLNSGFTFGAPAAKDDAESASALPSTNAIAGLFKFGPMTNDTKAEAPKPKENATGFSAPSFGSGSGGAFTFGGAAKPVANDLGSGATKRKTTTDEPSAKRAGFGSGTTPTPFTFSATPAAPAQTSTVAPAFSFSATSTSAEAPKPTAAAAPAAPTFTFGAAAAAAAAPKTGAFTFGAPNPTAAAKGDVSTTPAFGAPPGAVNAAPPPAPAPAFGAQPTPVFGSTTTAAAVPSFGSGSGSAFGSGSVFGSTPASSAPAKPMFSGTPSFGQPAPPPYSASAPRPSFGAPANDTSAFGGAKTNATTGFDFSAAGNPNPSGFNFGAQTGGVFQFGAPSATSTPAAPSFNFTAGSSNAPAAPQAFMFNAQPPGAGAVANPFNAAPSSALANRKIKKATRRR